MGVSVIVVAAAALAAVAAVSGAAYDPTSAGQLVYLAASAYCPQDAVMGWTCAACNQVGGGFKPTAYLSNAPLDLAGFVGQFDDGTAGVSFRGTVSTSIRDWLDDLNFTQTIPYGEGNCPGCEVHEGFLESYQSMAAEMFSALESLGATTVQVTGHSLGAAMAALAAFELANKGFTVHCITYGQPRVGNPAFATAYAALLSDSYRLVHYADIVPHVPTESMGFHHVPTEVWYQEDNTTYKVCDGSGEDPTCSDSVLLPISISDHLNYLGVAVSKTC